MSTGGKKKGKKGGGADDAADMKRDQKLQSIVMADSFTKNFRPMTWERPKVLLPLVNVPMLEYTLEFLAQNGVEEIFLVCVWHADQLELYIQQSKWSRSSVITVHCIALQNCMSAGDAIREIDNMGLIRSDPFVMISGDVISNMDLKRAIEFHKGRRKEDSNAIMSVVLKPIQKHAGISPVMDDLVCALDRKTCQMILFDNQYKNQSVQIPLQLLKEHPNVAMRNDLLDCHIDICSPELILQFSDNFDYQDIRRDFIQNEVVNWELGMHIYGYILENRAPYSVNEYAARVQDPKTYHSISRDLVTRWVYPIVPDSGLLMDGDYALIPGTRNVYREQPNTIARSAKIEEGVVLARDVVVEDRVFLQRSIVGRNCVIHPHASVIESHLWAGVHIHNNAVVRQAILCEGCVIKSGARIGRGCILTRNVIIGEGVVLPDYTRVSLKRKAEGEDSSEEEVSDYDYNVVGPDGKGYVYTYTGSGDYDEDEVESDSDEDEDCFGGVTITKESVLKSMNIGCVEEVELRKALDYRRPPPPEIDSDEDDEEIGEEEELRNFYKSVADMISTGRVEGHAPENLLMEIKGLKFAQNKTYSNCLCGALPELLFIPIKECTSESINQMSYLSAVKKLIAEKGFATAVIKPLIQGQEEMVTIIEGAEEFVLLYENAIPEKCSFSLFGATFQMLLQLLEDAELVSEEAFEAWIEQREVEAEQEEEDLDEMTIKRVKLFQHSSVQDFVEYVKEEGEEESEEESED